MRLFLLILAFVISGVLPASGVSALDREVSEFLHHRSIILSVEFSNGSVQLTDIARSSLDHVIDDLKTLMDEDKVIRIEGHASQGGDEQDNLLLSMRRAMEVRAYLMSQYGLEFDLFFNGYGSQGSPAETVVELASYDDTLGVSAADVDQVVTR